MLIKNPMMMMNFFEIGGIKNKDKQSCNFCMGHSALTWSIILPSITKIFVTVVELCSGNHSEEKIWIRGHN